MAGPQAEHHQPGRRRPAWPAALAGGHAPPAGLWQAPPAFHQFVGEHAARYGWIRSKAERIQRGIRILLGTQDTPGAAIRRSDVALLSRIKHSAAVVAQVLAAAGMLEDDRTPPIVRWFGIQVAELPEAMRGELDVRFAVMRASALRPDEAGLLTLTQREGRALREVADTGIPYTTLRQRHLRARNRLRRFLETTSHRA